MSNFGYYIFLLAAIILVFVLIKKVASCMVKTVIFLVLLAAMAYIYFYVL